MLRIFESILLIYNFAVLIKKQSIFNKSNKLLIK